MVCDFCYSILCDVLLLLEYPSIFLFLFLLVLSFLFFAFFFIISLDAVVFVTAVLTASVLIFTDNKHVSYWEINMLLHFIMV